MKFVVYLLFILLSIYFSELKPQYADQQPSTANPNELPILLQMIQHRNANVFKSGAPQYHKQREC